MIGARRGRLWFSVGFALAGLLAVGVLDAALYRDVWITIGDGYVVGAPHAGAPYAVYYIPGRDGRQYSDWVGHYDPGGRFPTMIFNATTFEHLAPRSMGEACGLMRLHNARPQFYGGIVISDVDRFQPSANAIYGRASTGYFVIVRDGNCVERELSRDDVVTRLASHGIAFDEPRHIVSRFASDRDAWARATYLIILAVAFACGIVAWRRG